jgi:hypothetical protein
MVFPPGAKPVILMYEFLRLLVVCATRVGRTVMALPASWYAAAPLLALPLVLQVLCQLSSDRGYDRLYLLAKGLSVLGCLVYAIRTLAAVVSETNPIDYYALSSSKSFSVFVLFFLIDVILLCMNARKNYKTGRKRGLNDASFD